MQTQKKITNNTWTFPLAPHAPGFALPWEEISHRWPVIRALRGVPQDPHYHAEGDVYIHTRMVVEELLRLPAWQQLGSREQQLVFAACLLHDIGKPACTRLEDNGRITSQGHAKTGEYMARGMLYVDAEEFNGIGFYEREHIARLVRLHGLPLWFMEKDNTEKAVLRASLQTNMEWLALVAEADVRGRICEDQQELLEKVEFFRLYCQENACYRQPKQFASDHSRYMYFQREDHFTEYELFDDTAFEVVMMSGLPGAGKDSYILDHLPDMPVVSLDALRREMKVSPTDNQGVVIQAAKEKAKGYLRKKQSFVWNATNVTRALRQPLIELFRVYGARVKIVYVETPYRRLLQQNQNREEVVPSPVISKLIQKLEVPDLSEAHQVIYALNE